MALLADARTGVAARSENALAARARQCLGGSAADRAHPYALPEAFSEQLRRLSRLPTREWQRLELEDLVTWLQCGRWWRQAGLKASHGAAEASADADVEFDPDTSFFDEEDEEDEEDDADEILSSLPISEQSDAQLARAFRAWAQQAKVEARHWLLRPVHAGPPPIWMDGRTLGSRAAPQWATACDVAQALGLDLDELLWLAPSHAHWRERAGGALPPSHYRYRLLPKRSSGLRLLEAPLPRLAEAQRKLLALALNPVPVHEAVHGFVRGRSVASHVAAHAGQALVVRLDLRDFFTHVHATRVRAMWRALGHTRTAADLLTHLTTVRTPSAVRERLLDATAPDPQIEPMRWIEVRRARSQALARPHLPQGAPTSPAIANLCAFGMDVRLAALAERFGSRYSRYADDMVFSGGQDLRRQWPNLRAWVSAIVRDEGFALHAGKTRLMPAHQRQQVTGVVLNRLPNLPREQYDALKAKLHRLAEQPGIPVLERQRLLGQLQWARQWLAPARGAKLQALFDAIRFDG